MGKSQLREIIKPNLDFLPSLYTETVSDADYTIPHNSTRKIINQVLEVLFMSLIRWQPLAEIDNLQREMNNLFNSIVPNTSNIKSSSLVPAAEMSETPEAVHLKLEVPGLDAKDIDIQATAESIAISGERKSETKTESEGITRSEFHYGSFSRVIPLPARIKNTEVSAEYKDGILSLTLPKAAADKSQVVKVSLD